MKDDYLFWGGLLLIHVSLIAAFYYRKWRYKQGGADIANFRYNSYLTIREEVFSAKPNAISNEIPIDSEVVHCVVVELYLPEELMCYAYFANGDIWAFSTSTGAKHVIRTQNEDTKMAVSIVFNTAKYHFARMSRKDKITPLSGYLKLYILTNYDNYSCDGPIADMMHEDSPWKEMVQSTLDVLDQLQSLEKQEPL